MNGFFILLLCEKKLCDCRSEKKNDVTHYERNANCFLYFKKKQQQLNHFLIRFK